MLKVMSQLLLQDSPLISVVLLCHNHEQFVAEALEGLFAQTYSPLDVIIVDDCSQDRTAEIVKANLPKRDKREIRFIQNEQNLGLLGAREVGFRMARGALVVDTCDDDVMLPEMVAELSDVWRTAGVSLVTANAEYIDAESKPLGRMHRDLNAPIDDSFETLARDGANACCFGAGIAVEREVYTTFGMPPAHLNNLDIMLPFYAYLLKGARYVRKPLFKYRVHGNNASLSLIAERSDLIGRLRTEERIFHGHLAHSVVMHEVLDDLSKTMPSRYAELAPRIAPLLTIQTVEMAKKYLKTQTRLQELENRL